VICGLWRIALCEDAYLKIPGEAEEVHDAAKVYLNGFRYQLAKTCESRQIPNDVEFSTSPVVPNFVKRTSTCISPILACI
jgi:hypothetical protein